MRVVVLSIQYLFYWPPFFIESSINRKYILPYFPICVVYTCKHVSACVINNCVYMDLYMYMHMCTVYACVCCTYGTSHKKVSTVTPYVTLLNDYLFSTYNSITCILRLMLSVHTHAYYEVRIRYGIQYAQHVACKLSVQRGGRGAKA